MNLDFYKNFLVIAECGNITQAAERLNIAQPALSSQLKALEAHYGTSLIDARRGRRQIRLTTAGVDFLRRAREICRAEESLLLDLQAYARGQGGTLRLATSPAVMETFMERFILPFSRRHPSVTLQLKEEIVPEQLDGIKKGRIDIAYANAPLPEADSINCRQLATEHFFLVGTRDCSLWSTVGRGLPLDESTPVPLTALGSVPLSCNHTTIALLTRLCHNYGFTPDIRLAADTGHAVIKYAASGLGLAVVSGSSCRAMPARLLKVPLNEPDLTYSQTLLWPRERSLSPAARDFLAFIEDNL